MALISTIELARRRFAATSLAFAAIAAAGAVLPVTAAEVTLRAKGGGLEVTGELKSFDGSKYIVEAPKVGLMTFDAARVECIGDACLRRVIPQALPLEPLNAATPEIVTIHAASAVAEALLPALIRGYANALGASVTPIVGTTPGDMRLRLNDPKGGELATFVIHRDGAAAALSALQQSSIDLAFTNRPVGEQSTRVVASAAGVEAAATLTENFVALDGLAIVVSPENPAISLSEDTLARIFAGKITNWTDAGVAGGKIRIFTVGGDASAFEAVANSLLKQRGLALVSSVTELPSESAVADAIARDANAIGIVSFAMQRNAKRLNIEGSCGIITTPSSFAAKAGEYPLTRRLLLSSAGELKNAAARGLLRYATSKDAQSVIADAGFIDRLTESLPIDEHKGRMGAALNAPPQVFDMEQMRQLLADLKNARRLSIAFRFQPGTIELDVASRREIGRLAELLQSPDYAGKAVLLIGFSDAEGKFSVSMASSAKRAAQLKAAIMAAAGKLSNTLNVSAKGYGALAPVVCNDTPEHRHINRRIEVWVKD